MWLGIICCLFGLIGTLDGLKVLSEGSLAHDWLLFEHPITSDELVYVSKQSRGQLDVSSWLTEEPYYSVGLDGVVTEIFLLDVSKKTDDDGTIYFDAIESTTAKHTIQRVITIRSDFIFLNVRVAQCVGFAAQNSVGFHSGGGELNGLSNDNGRTLAGEWATNDNTFHINIPDKYTRTAALHVCYKYSDSNLVVYELDYKRIVGRGFLSIFSTICLGCVSHRYDFPIAYDDLLPYENIARARVEVDHEHASSSKPSKPEEALCWKFIDDVLQTLSYSLVYYNFKYYGRFAPNVPRNVQIGSGFIGPKIIAGRDWVSVEFYNDAGNKKTLNEVVKHTKNMLELRNDDTCYGRVHDELKYKFVQTGVVIEEIAQLAEAKKDFTKTPTATVEKVPAKDSPVRVIDTHIKSTDPVVIVGQTTPSEDSNEIFASDTGVPMVVKTSQGYLVPTQYKQSWSGRSSESSIQFSSAASTYSSAKSYASLLKGEKGIKYKVEALYASMDQIDNSLVKLFVKAQITTLQFVARVIAALRYAASRVVTEFAKATKLCTANMSADVCICNVVEPFMNMIQEIEEQSNRETVFTAFIEGVVDGEASLISTQGALGIYFKVTEVQGGRKQYSIGTYTGSGVSLDPLNIAGASGAIGLSIGFYFGDALQSNIPSIDFGIDLKAIAKLSLHIEVLFKQSEHHDPHEPPRLASLLEGILTNECKPTNKILVFAPACIRGISIGIEFGLGVSAIPLSVSVEFHRMQRIPSDTFVTAWRASQVSRGLEKQLNGLELEIDELGSAETISPFLLY